MVAWHRPRGSGPGARGAVGTACRLPCGTRHLGCDPTHFARLRLAAFGHGIASQSTKPDLRSGPQAAALLGAPHIAPGPLPRGRCQFRRCALLASAVNSRWLMRRWALAPRAGKEEAEGRGTEPGLNPS